MSWILAALGFCALIILHELGHFAAAKAVGMRVERFSLFFPPLMARKKWGETEYGIGAVPLGGYVKITGMNPAEEIPPEVAHRAYYRQKVWKRIVVIAAGPAVNIALAFLILWVIFMSNGTTEPPSRVQTVERGLPAASVLREGDVLLAVDGKRPAGDSLDTQTQSIANAIASHKCAGKPTEGCQAAQPVRLTVRRDGTTRTFTLTPVYDPAVQRTRLGFSFTGTHYDAGAARAAGLSAEEMWRVTSGTVSVLARIFQADQREKLSGVVGSYEATRRSIEFGTTDAMIVLALISLSLGVINLFPFLPLDGGHIFWAVAEKVRGRAIPFSVMERAGFVGFVLVIALAVIGLSNDITHITNGDFGQR
jgi:regulator of sigma E protease